MKKRIFCIVLSATLMLALNLDVNAGGIGTVGPYVPPSPPPKKMDKGARYFQHYRYMFPEKARYIGNGRVRISKHNIIQFMWRAMPPIPGDDPQVNVNLASTDKKTDTKPPGIPGLMGIPGLGGPAGR